MAQNSTDQKKQIVADLQAVSLLKSVVPMDQVKDLLTIEWPNGLPGVIVPMPQVKSSTKADQWHNDRVYDWTIFVVTSIDQQSNYWDLETVIDAVLNALDNDETLGGNAWPAVEPATGESFTMQDAQKTITITPISFKAHALVDITP